MTTDPSVLLAALRGKGLSIRIDPDDRSRILISPSASITADDREAIKAHKPALLGLLDREALDEEAAKLPTPFRGGRQPRPAGRRPRSVVGQQDGLDGDASPGVGSPGSPAGDSSPGPGRAGTQGSAAKAYSGWLREPPRKWAKVCEAATMQDCWRLLLAIPSEAKTTERRVSR